MDHIILGLKADHIAEEALERIKAGSHVLKFEDKECNFGGQIYYE